MSTTNDNPDSPALTAVTGSDTSAGLSPVSARSAGGDTTPSIAPYVAPIFAYVFLGSLEGYLPRVDGAPDPTWYMWAYCARFAIVGFLAWWFRVTWKDFRPAPGWPALVLAALLGLVVWFLWVGLDGRYPILPFQGKRMGFDPGRLGWLPRILFIGVRMLGLVLLVPLIEELFWRSFLMRWLVDPDIRKVAIGRVTPMAAAVTSVMFAAVHPEWLPALLTGLLWAWLLWWTRSITACFVSHAVANLALGVYVIVTGDWKYW